MTAMVGWAGTAEFREQWVFDGAAETYALDPEMAKKLAGALLLAYVFVLFCVWGEGRLCMGGCMHGGARAWRKSTKKSHKKSQHVRTSATTNKQTPTMKTHHTPLHTPNTNRLQS